LVPVPAGTYVYLGKKHHKEQVLMKNFELKLINCNIAAALCEFI